MMDPDILIATASTLRQRLDPCLDRSVRANAEEWTAVDLLALARAGCEVLARAHDCQAEIVFVRVSGCHHPLVRLRCGSSSFEVDLAADRFSHDLVRAASGRLYRDAEEEAPFVSAEAYNAMQNSVGNVLKWAGLAVDDAGPS
jgi:hypothetical protein